MGDVDGVTGRLIAERYRLRGPLAEGGMGEVWEAYDERLDGRRVVVKMMLAERPSRGGGHLDEALETRRERFLREVRTTAAIEHLGIPAVYDAGVDPGSGRLFIVMQLIRGRELRTLIDETDHAVDPVPVALAAALGAQIASVLYEVHRHDIVHRDIKPENLMMTPGGIVKVLDFGVAALLGSGDNPRLTQVGMTVGTPPYMSPEQALANTVGATSDVYALACVLFEVLTGGPPFPRTASQSQLWHHVHSTPPPIADLRADVPAEFAALLSAMLDKDAEERPEAAEVYERLLPLASRAATAPADIGDLDPCLPFVRPLGGALRRRASVKASMAPTAMAPAITEEEIEEIIGIVEELLHQQRFIQASDLLEDARGRATEPDVVNELSFKLAHARFIAGSFTEAADLFVQAGEYFAGRYGEDDPDARLARYYLAQCRAELGDVGGAIEAFRNVAAAPVGISDREAQDRHLDALTSLMRLYAAAQRRDLFLETTAQTRNAILRYRPADAGKLLAEMDAYAARLSRLLGE
jgi:serine/threonine protein kinase